MQIAASFNVRCGWRSLAPQNAANQHKIGLAALSALTQINNLDQVMALGN